MARGHGGDRTLNARGLMKLRKILIVAAVSGVALATGGWLLQRDAAPEGSVYQQARLFEDVLAHVADYYVDSLEERIDVVVGDRSEEHTSELQSLAYLVCRLLLEKKTTANV